MKFLSDYSEKRSSHLILLAADQKRADVNLLFFVYLIRYWWYNKSVGKADTGLQQKLSGYHLF